MTEELTADEMFEKLGYKLFEGLYEIKYHSKNGNIDFDKIHNSVNIYKLEDEDFIDMQELQAINKKVEELKWI